MLCSCLGDEDSRVRVMAAYCVSNIATYDWPDEWPDLFEGLVGSLQSGSPPLVHGCMRVFTEFSGEVDDTQLPLVLPRVMPTLYGIFVNAQGQDIRTRARALVVLRQFLQLLAAMSGMADVVSTVINPILPSWVEAFVNVLSTVEGPSVDFGLHSAVLQLVDALVHEFPDETAPFLPTLIPPIWNLFLTHFNVYVAMAVTGAGEIEAPVDEDGNVLGMERMIGDIMLVIIHVAESGTMRQMLAATLNDLMFYLIGYSQMTVDQEDMWMADVDEFVSAEFEENPMGNTLRDLATDCIDVLIDSYRSAGLNALLGAVQRCFEQGSAAMAQQDEHWWRWCEAGVSTLANAAPSLLEAIKKPKCKVDQALLQGLLGQLPQYASNAATPFLMGRTLSTVGAFGEVTKKIKK